MTDDIVTRRIIEVERRRHTVLRRYRQAQHVFEPLSSGVLPANEKPLKAGVSEHCEIRRVAVYAMQREAQIANSRNFDRANTHCRQLRHRRIRQTESVRGTLTSTCRRRRATRD